MPLVIAIDRLKGADRFLQAGKSEHPLAIREKGTRAGMLNDHRFAAGQKAKRPVADPSRLKLDISGLGAAKLPSRLLDIGPVCFWGSSDFQGMTNTPAVAFKKLAV